MKINLTLRQRDTVLAALRLYQKFLADGWQLPFAIESIASDQGKPLSEEEIDELCEEINS